LLEDDCSVKRSQHETRRKALQQIIVASGVFTVVSANAVMTDETTSLATESTDSTYRQQSPASSETIPSSTKQQTLAVPSSLSDEVAFTISKSDLQKRVRGGGGLGLELGETSFKTNFRVIVKSVAPNSLAESLGIKPGFVVVSVNGADAERTNASGVAIYFSRAVEAALAARDGSLTLTFRDPSKFRKELENFPVTADNGGESSIATVSTKVAPAGTSSSKPGVFDGEQNDQVITVSQLIPPKVCRRRATTDDLVEISYIGQVAETGAIFDGSAVKINGEGIPGRGNDISLYFVLGKQPFGQFPPGWDVGMDGMCVGERRRLLIPPVLAFGSVGVPRRGIPPNATLQYDITLVSINGLATPQ
jgi:FKBP-type peptidyl-prolyl cis-trans isomerase